MTEVYSDYTLRLPVLQGTKRSIVRDASFAYQTSAINARKILRE